MNNATQNYRKGFGIFSTQIVASISIDQFSNKGEKEGIWKILLRNDRNKSQHRRIKKQRRYERLGS